ncbi:basic leucine zipper 61-like [Aristolochia californica]|uniref:basic leucine zipper 61-like n=1 Tax=Aristolochia californica TaxID=171875 RepID=UPI0035E0FE47
MEASGLPPRPPTSIRTNRQLQYPPEIGASFGSDTILAIDQPLALPPAGGSSLQIAPVSHQSSPGSGLNCRMDRHNSEEDRKAKRMVANRQSALRARLKKAQHRDTLEKSLSSLEIEIATLTPKVAEYEKLAMVLSLENESLKQQLAHGTQENELKDERYEFMKHQKQKLVQLLCIQSQPEHQLSAAGELAMQVPSLNMRGKSSGSSQF